ncbi:hypothetical protein [Micromonospora endolithica]|uniref:PH domain-containing protein n=1 Tax=Micromonospora endolithica TaxID=230091 RepID=A0A3A9Z5J5_9ACTN|nr:hypothetical protein [Micromonospora endolithica]RKN43565.1 hypothetical protein D7223_21300 [Micromonospora endolithica]TWJ24166.1 hypothetical protein JD76_04314 [Micromonospora endolithica]
MREIIDGALRRQRLRAVGAVGIGLIFGLTAVRIRDVGGPLVLLTALPLLILLWIALRQTRRRPSDGEFRVDERERAFFAPPRPEAGFLPFLVGFTAYQSVTTWVAADGGSALRALAVFFASATVAWVTVGWRNVPSVELTAEGIVHRRHEKGWFVPWSALDPAGRVGSANGVRTISLPISRPDLVRSSGWGRGRSLVAVGDLDVAPALLAGALRHYLAQPERRAEIGTPAEYARLRRALTGDA